MKPLMEADPAQPTTLATALATEMTRVAAKRLRYIEYSKEFKNANFSVAISMMEISLKRAAAAINGSDRIDQMVALSDLRAFNDDD